MNCNICGKPLTDPVSLEFGIGPVCRLKLKIESAKNRTGNLFSPRASFSYSVRGNVICITDHDSGKSVTNDIHAVLDDLRADGIDLSAFQVVYCDTYRIWDEVVLVDGSFSTFRSLNERTLDAALAKLQEKGRARAA
ncbi:hypothetical protein KPB05_37335 [Burkholderia gladioli]|nr:hypothetical protein [Burkholderia gladioli]